jgi:monoamine oxidase
MEGGMHLLTVALEKAVAANNGLGGKGVPVQINSKVTAMTDLGSHISVTVQKGETVETKEYAAVFNTTTLGCLQKIDISGLNLDKEVLTGIRVLGYDRSCKLAIKFRHNWWQDIALLGGASNTDLPVRTVVYPSWNDGPNNPAVLLASYTWAQDATRIGALIHNTDKEISDKEDPVLVLALENLVKLFASTAIRPTLQQLKDLYISHHAFAWQQDPATAGAFALFGPQQFKDMYPYMRDGYCDNKFFIAGEATSAHHAWIVGALDSAAFVVAKYFAANDKFEALAHLKASDQVSGGAGKLPEEFDEDVFLEQVKLGKKAKA